MTHTMKLYAQPFSLVATGNKTIELRLNDEKRQKIKVGDTIVFTHAECAEKRITSKVTALYPFPTFQALYQALPLDKCGYVAPEIATASYQDMYAYYTPEQENQFGVIGIEIMVCEK